MVLVHATFDRVYLDCRVYHSLTVDLDGELRLDLAPDVAGLAAVDALVLVAPQVRDDERRLHPVAVLVVRRQQDVVVLSIGKYDQFERHQSNQRASQSPRGSKFKMTCVFPFHPSRQIKVDFRR